jgi:hypothetical protein
MTRGMILILIAVVIGVVLIRTAVDGDATVTGGAAVTTSIQPSQTTSPQATETPTTETTPLTGEAGTTPTSGVFVARPAGEVQVQVVNTTGVSGAASRRTDELKTLGYQTLKPTNATDGALAVTKIFHIDGYLFEGLDVATSLGLTADNVFFMPDAPGANITDYENPQVLVLVGTDKSS